jgi:hypothetical protein
MRRRSLQGPWCRLGGAVVSISSICPLPPRWFVEKIDHGRLNNAMTKDKEGGESSEDGIAANNDNKQRKTTALPNSRSGSVSDTLHS